MCYENKIRPKILLTKYLSDKNYWLYSIVVVHDQDTQRGFWKLAWAEWLIVGRDELARGALVRVPPKSGHPTLLQSLIQLLYPLEVSSGRGTLLQRPIQLLYLLEVSSGCGSSDGRTKAPSTHLEETVDNSTSQHPRPQRKSALRARDWLKKLATEELETLDFDSCSPPSSSVVNRGGECWELFYLPSCELLLLNGMHLLCSCAQTTNFLTWIWTLYMRVSIALIISFTVFMALLLGLLWSIAVVVSNACFSIGQFMEAELSWSWYEWIIVWRRKTEKRYWVPIDMNLLQGQRICYMCIYDEEWWVACILQVFKNSE